LEGFFEGRPISIWEMRNPLLMEKFADTIFEYNFNPVLREACQKINAIDEKSLYIDLIINKWAD